MREKELKHIENLLLLKVKKEKIEETDKIKEYLKGLKMKGDLMG